MTRPCHRAAAAVTISAVILAAGCGNPAPAGRRPAAQAPVRNSVTLSSVLATATGAWAVAVMGGPSADHDNFWQVFARQAGSIRWTLATPPGVADNGGLVLAYASGESLIAGFRPSQDLTYTPLTATSDGGQAWSSANPLDGDLADVPDALAFAPGSGQLLALLADGTAMLAAPGYASWSTLTTERNLAGTPPGQRCGLTSLTAAAFTPAGAPLLAGTCTRPGIAGIFVGQAGTWRPAGPPLPAALASQPITVLRLTRLAGTTVALLAAGTGNTAALLAAWSSGSGTHWKLSPPLRLGGAHLTSASFGSDGTAALTLTPGTGETVTEARASWQSLPALPAGTATLAPGPGGSLDALAVHRSVLTVWHLARGALTWHTTQAIDVPIQLGSSG
jgi:hypothetical protein